MLNWLFSLAACHSITRSITRRFAPLARRFSQNDGRGGFHFHGTGNHLILDPFYSYGKAESYGVNTIVHGDRSLLVIKQGKIGLALNKGQPILLPPGLHQWKDPVLVYQKSFDLNNNVIRLGPLTLVTVDEGYCAVTEDNGRQVILDGGDTYLLTHRNHKVRSYEERSDESFLVRLIAVV